MDARTNRPHSPSARFYASRQSEVYDTPFYPAPEQESPQIDPSFSHFQGFSAPASSHRCNNSSCAGRLSDERLSPRTVIPYHDRQMWNLPGLRLGQPSAENGRTVSTKYGSPQQNDHGLAQSFEDHQGLGRGRQLSEPPTCLAPPPLYYSSPENALAPALIDRPVSMMFPPRGAPTRPRPVPVQHQNTIRVPSYSQTSETGQQSQQLIDVGHTLASDKESQLASVSDEDDMSTVYPCDSTTTTSSTAVCPSAHARGVAPRPLEEAVVEVHDTCLAATQRYLESLRMNWELRQGHEILAQPGLAGPTRRLRDRACARGSPYPLPRRRRRALSDNSGLEYMRSLRGGDYTGDKEEGGDGETRGHRRQHAQPNCPIPAPTNSLLQNTSHICELIWRRACRDREDVLGAEAAGARKLGLLVGCAEVVVLYDAAEWEGDQEKRFYTACRAGRDFCTELGDLRGVGTVEGIERGEVRDEAERGGGPV